VSILRFSSQEAMEAAFGKRINIRDTFCKAVPGEPLLARPEETAPKKCRVRRKFSGATPHDILWDAASKSLGGVEREFEGAVPGRRFRLDIALPAARLAIEVDGWEWHGKHKGDFTRDRERQNLLTLHGWRILRFTAGQIRKDVAGCIEMIRQASAGASHD
jgi:very-short-patch-repair endonuclease